MAWARMWAKRLPAMAARTSAAWRACSNRWDKTLRVIAVRARPRMRLRTMSRARAPTERAPSSTRLAVGFSRATAVTQRSFGNRELSPHLIAFFTSAAIRFSSAAVSFVSAKDVGHMLPSSRFASGWNPNVAYLTLNFDAAWKKQMIWPSLVA